MGTLGDAIILAMRDQGWLIISEPEAILCLGPSRVGVVIPTTLLEPDQEWRLRIVLLNLIATHGLQWPWPPDHVEDVQGEVPRHDE